MDEPKIPAPEDEMLRDVAAGKRLDAAQREAYADYVERTRQQGRSDMARWSSSRVFHSAWDVRTRAMAALLPRKARSVVDFGCGPMALREMLQRSRLRSAMRYIPADMVPRGDDTVIIDLNAADPPALPEADVAFFSGVLEYMLDLPRLTASLGAVYPHVVCSYVTTEDRYSDPRERRRNGWVNDYPASELIALFEQAGYRPMQMRHLDPHRLFVFTRRAP